MHRQDGFPDRDILADGGLIAALVKHRPMRVGVRYSDDNMTDTGQPGVCCLHRQVVQLLLIVVQGLHKSNYSSDRVDAVKFWKKYY